MAAKSKLSDEDLIAILRKEEAQAGNWNDSELSEHRLDAQSYYDREPLGDEQDGQSKVVTSELADTVESFMPSLMRVFASGEEVAEFTPPSPQHEKAAKEATQYVPHVFMRENDGFRVLYWFFKGALMNRLAAMTVDSDEKEKRYSDEIKGWTAEQIAAAHELLTEKKGATEIEAQVEPDPQDVDPTTGMPAPQTFSGVLNYVCKKKCVVVDNIAEEDILIAPPDARDIDSASFAGYRKEVTASALRMLGMEQEDIDELSSERAQSSEEWSRQGGDPGITSERKDSERKFWLVVAYVRADDNGDGISEMLRVVYAHAGGQVGRIIERMEWEDPEAPIVPGTPIMMPHTIVGRSIFDQVRDLQDVGTALTRGLLDNVYLTNRPRPVINKRVDINSVLDWTPGRPITVDSNEDTRAALSYISVPSIMAPAQAALEYFATVRENRTGVTRYNQGLDADSLNKTASGINMVMTAAQQRQELIARVFAETAIKRLMRLIYRAIKRNASGPIKYHAGDDWAECDPTKWPDDMELVVNVALGTGNKQQELQNLMLLAGGQEKLVLAQGGTPDGPLVRLEHLANTFRKGAEAAGFKSTSQFIASPKEIEQAKANPKPPRPDPEMAKVQAQAEAKKVEQEQDFVLAQQKQANEIQLAQQKNAADMEMARQKNDMEFAHKQRMLAAEYDLKVKELKLEAVLEKYRIDNTPEPDQANIPQAGA
jgi:hypothetical protein